MTYFDVPDRFNAIRASGEDHAGVGLLGALKISFELRFGQWVSKKARAPFNEIGLRRQPGDQAQEVLATEWSECNSIS